MTAPTLEPLATIDIHDDTWEPYEQEDLHGHLLDWARGHGIDVNNTYRLEIYLLDCPFARVFTYGRDDEYRMYCPLDHDHRSDIGECIVAMREPYDVILASFPPAPVLPE